jgi:hypothetical protein
VVQAADAKTLLLLSVSGHHIPHGVTAADLPAVPNLPDGKPSQGSRIGQVELAEFGRCGNISGQKPRSGIRQNLGASGQAKIWRIQLRAPNCCHTEFGEPGHRNEHDGDDFVDSLKTGVRRQVAE